VDPAGGLAERLAGTAGLALQQGDLPGGGFGAGGDQAAAEGLGIADAPFRAPELGVFGGRRARVAEELGHVETDAAGADDGDARADRGAAQHVEIAEHVGQVLAGNAGIARQDAGGEDHRVEAGERAGGRLRAEAQVDAGLGDRVRVVGDEAVELLLAGNAAGEVQLAADRGVAFEERDAMAAAGGDERGGEAGRAGADHGDAARAIGGGIDQFGLVAGARVDEAGGDLQLEGVVEAGLVAGDAGDDGMRPAGAGLRDEFRIGEERPGHRDHVGAALGEHRLGHLRRVDPVRGDERDRDRAHQLPRHPGEGGAGDGGGDGRDARLVPADAGVDQGGARRRDRAGEGHDSSQLWPSGIRSISDRR
jgi:hypothetical protein